MDKCILDPERDCLGLIQAKKLEEDLSDLRSRNDSSHKEFFDRIAILESHNKIQDVHYEHIIEKLSDITDKLASLGTRIAAIEIKPAKRWDGIVEKFIFTVIGAAASYIAMKLGFS